MKLFRVFRGRLYVKIYLTVILSLAAIAVASGIYWSTAIDREEIGWAQRRDRFIAEMLPTGEDPVLTQATVERFAKAFDADIALYASDRRLLAAAGEDLPPPPGGQGFRDDEDDGWFADRQHRRPFVIDLADGRVLVARLDVPWDGPKRGALGYLMLIAGVIALVAYPFVRQLTRRLESLRAGVEAFGKGDLVSRVPVEGRDEVAAVAKSFNAAADRIERLVGAHRALLANASHELRSPVTRLRMAMDLYETPQDGPAREEMLRNLGEIDELVDEILLASRLDHVKGLERPERLDLFALATEECARHGVEATGAPADVLGDARLLTRLVRNLVVNALRHGRPPVDVEVREDRGRVLLSVRDHGDGLPKGEETRVFEPFYRPAGRSEAAGGWGLGLALVRQIAEHHGGSVRVEPAQGGGARFVVDLPRAVARS
ncbi:MAG: HAMP domain-containing sensor histidine kinase [Pseudomonadota bacterium]